MTRINAQQGPRRPLRHPVETMCTIALGAGGQLLLSWWLARAAGSAEQADLRPAEVTPAA